ncbi:uncharacterized protein N7496_000123 [Penicillium cataractarum]|uniref:Uncharacterized protein n=1 Tax=Penicillium cataractarum TaxID=2100454 RepID=A0A9W9VTQ1_9EURO|nr:uncharacterized protein N7496_000123 [Penicillium cataractarum]KAJ5389055.1 hypothetical protein N7496_000123 [Penicillium cataractarum]
MKSDYGISSGPSDSEGWKEVRRRKQHRSDGVSSTSGKSDWSGMESSEGYSNANHARSQENMTDDALTQSKEQSEPASEYESSDGSLYSTEDDTLDQLYKEKNPRLRDQSSASECGMDDIPSKENSCKNFTKRLRGWFDNFRNPFKNKLASFWEGTRKVCSRIKHTAEGIILCLQLLVMVIIIGLL